MDYLFSALILLLILIISITFIVCVHKNHRLNELYFENQQLAILTELREKELAAKALQLANMNEKLMSTLKRIKKLPIQEGKTNEKERKSIMSDIQLNLPEEAWKEFETRFSELNSVFYRELLDKCPALTPTELRICGMLRLNLTSKEIALISNRSLGTIENSRSSIRKKLDLKDDDNLATYLINI
nr:hypothetical protein [uncultured Draconibacterium sp.]